MPVKNILTVEKGNHAGQSFTYKGEKILMLGRQRSCSIVFTDATVSNNHCILEISPKSVLVRDCDSTNGTFINGKKIGRYEDGNSGDEVNKTGFSMKTGDRLGLGKSCELKLEIIEVQNCAVCNDEVENITHRGPDGKPICDTCHSDPDKVLKHLIESAKSEKES